MHNPGDKLLEGKIKKSNGRRIHYGIWILILGTLTNFGCIGLGRFAIGMIIPEMSAGLGLTNTQIGIIVSSTFLGYLASTAGSGALATRFGPRKVIASSMVLVSAGMVLAGTTTGFLMALLAQLLIGVGSGGSNVPTFGLIARWYNEKFRGMALGITLTGGGLSFVLAGVFIPYLVGFYGEEGWRASWYYLASMVLLIAVLGAAIFRDEPSEIGMRPVGDSNRNINSSKPARIDEGDQVQWRELYLLRPLRKLGFAYFMFGFSYVIFTTYYAKYLIEEANFTQVFAGQIWLIIGIVSLTSGFTWGYLSDRIGRKNVLFITYSIQGFALMAIAVTKAPFLIITASIIYALTLWSIPSVMSAACADYVGSVLAPAAIGMVTVFFGVGQVMSPWMSGIIKDLTHSFTVPFMISAGASIIGAVLTAFLTNPAESSARHE